MPNDTRLIYECLAKRLPVVVSTGGPLDALRTVSKTRREPLSVVVGRGWNMIDYIL